MKLGLKHSYANDLPGFHVPALPERAPAPRLLFWNQELGDSLGLDLAAEGEASLADLFSGNRLPEDARTIAQAYAGHQFGHFSSQLGDGRALLLGEVVDPAGKRFDLAFKGSGLTAFSRGGDGKAAVGPMLREALIGEFLNAMGIPTSRALAVVATGEEVQREVALPGAVLTRVAASHIRVGTFEFFAARSDVQRARRLADYAIARHDPDLVGQPGRHLAFLRAVARRQARLVAQWMNVGFIHGVMNTDNVTVSGESIDFGPCAFLEAYDPATVFSSIDRQGRYAFGNQAHIAQWNHARLCEAFLPLLGDDETIAAKLAMEIIDGFPQLYADFLLEGQRAKLGFSRRSASDDPSDAKLVEDWYQLLEADRIDFTLAWRRLADAAEGRDEPLQTLFTDGQAIESWLGRWRSRCAAEDSGADPVDGTSSRTRATAMRKVNPIVIPRNHLVEEALEAASVHGDLGPFVKLIEALRSPFELRPGEERFAEPAPAELTSRYRTYCGT